MTPYKTKKLRKFVGAWVLRQRKKTGLRMDAFGDLIGRTGSSVDNYEAGKVDMPFSAFLAIAYEADCTIEETQEVFEAYAEIRSSKQEGNICTKCDEEKPEEEFPLKGGGKPGRRSVCRTCVNAYSAEWRKKNKETAPKATAPKTKDQAKAPPEKKRHFPPFKGYAA